MPSDRIQRRSLEELVLERLRRQGEHDEHWTAPSAAAQAVQAVLGAVDLTPAERELLAAAGSPVRRAGVEPLTEEQRMQGLLGHRIERALAAAAEASGGGIVVPEVRVLSDRASRAEVSRFARELRPALAEPPTHGVWCLVDAGVLRRLDAHLASTAQHPRLVRDFTRPEPIGNRVLLERAATPLSSRLPRLARLAASSGETAERQAAVGEDRASATPTTPAELSLANGPQAPLARGAVFAGRYRVERVLEPREFGSVYLVRSLGAEGDSPLQLALVDPERFERHPDVAAAFDELVARRMELQHPATLTWRDGGFLDGRGFLVREDFPGVSLNSKLAEEAVLRPQHAAAILRELLAALEAAHRPVNGEPLLHGDLKPERILLSARSAMRGDGPMRVRAFGLARALGAPPAEAEPERRRVAGSEAETRRTENELPIDYYPHGRTAQGPGGESLRETCTPEYAAPEQAARALGRTRDPLTPASDLFAAGVIAYRMLTGQLPAEPRSSREQLLEDRANGEVLRLGGRDRAIPGRLAAIVDRLLAPDPAARYGDAGEALAELDAFLAPGSVGPALKLAVPLVGLAALVLGWAAVRAKGDVEYVMQSRQLAFGPALTRAVVPLTRADGQPISTDSMPLLVDLDGRPLRDWRARWIGSGELEFEATWKWPPGEVQHNARLQLGGRTVAEPFSLTWIGNDAWTFDPPRVHGVALDQLDGRAVDLEDLSLEFSLRGPATGQLESVALEIGERRRPLLPLPAARAVAGAAPTEAAPTEATLAKAALAEAATEQLAALGDEVSSLSYRLEDDVELRAALALPPGERHVALVARDTTGREERVLLPFETIDRPLDLGYRARLVDLAAADGVDAPECSHSTAETYFLLPRVRPALDLGLGGTALVDFDYELSGRVVEGAVSTLPADTPLALSGLEALGEGAPFRAAILWEANDADQVLRAQPELRGRASGRLQFDWSSAEADFDALFAYADGESLWIDDEGRLISSAAELTLDVSRQASVPMRLEARVFAADADAEPIAVLDNAELRNLTAGRARFDLQLPRDGRYRVRIASFQYGSPSGEAIEQPDTVREYRLHVDTRAPRLALDGLEPGMRFVATSSPELRLGVKLIDERPAAATPVAIDWRFEREGGLSEARKGRLRRGAVSTGGAETAADAEPRAEWERRRRDGESWLEAPLVLRAPWSAAEAERDGAWQLVLEAVDEAGNRGETLRIPFEVAARGPLLEAFEPQPERVWLPRPESVGWALRVRAEDPNGVQSVVARISSDGAALEPLKVELYERVPGSHMYEGEVELPHAWSEQRIGLAVLGIDESGAARNLELSEIELPTIVPERPASLATLGGREIAPMRLIPGNSGSAYVFGGRDDRVENELFERAQLPLFNPDVRSLPPRAWKLEYAAGQIADYYLDEREVTRGEFAGFVARGFGEARHWPAGSEGPSAARKLEFERALAGGDAGRPMTGVTWEEASAYAAWVGKRLPSWVEWEYAVRGGSLYRPFAGWVEELALEAGEQPALVNAGWALADRSDTAWAAHRLDDGVAGGVLGLSGNVAEWTASPVWFDDVSAGSQPRAHALAHRAELLDPRRAGSLEQVEEFWVAGASFSDRRFDFSCADARGRTERNSEIGFRCALSLNDYRRRETGYAADGADER